MEADLLEILDSLPDREEEALKNPQFQTEEFCARLLEHVDHVRTFHPRAAMFAARFALRLAAQQSASLFGQAWTVWAGVKRELARYEEAEVGQRLARLYLHEPVDLARRYRRQAHLLRDLGRFREAEQAATRAISIYLASGDVHARGCALVDLATVHLAERRYGDAVLRSCEALRHLDPHVASPYLDSALYNLAVALTLCGQPSAKLEVLLRNLRRQRYSKGSSFWAKHRWVEGLIFKARGRYDRAEVTLRAARNQLAKLGAAHDFGLVSIDLAELYLLNGDLDKAAHLARDTFAVFKSLEVERDAVAALRLFTRAAIGRALGSAEVDQARSVLRRFARPREALP